MEVDCSCCTGLLAESADIVLAVLEAFHVKTVVRGDCGHLRNSLGKRNVDRLAVVQVQVECVRNFLVRTLFDTRSAARAFRLVNIARMAFDVHLEVSDISFHTCNFRVGEDADVRILADFSHFRRDDTGRAVQCRESLVKLRHLSADRIVLLNNINRKSRVRNVECSRDSCDTAADYQCAFCHWCLAFNKRRVKNCLCDSCLAQSNGFFCRVSRFFHNP